MSKTTKQAVKSTKRKNDEVDTESDPIDPNVLTAKELFLAKYAKPTSTTRTIRTGGNSLPTVTVEGIVTRAKLVNVAGRKKGTLVPKLEVAVDVHRVRSNNAPDALLSGIEGFSWLLPTFKPREPTSAAARGADGVDDDPEAKKGFGDSKKTDRDDAPPRALALTPNHKTVWLGSMPKVSFYTTAAGGKDGDAEKAKAGIDLVVAGMPVEVTGVVAALSADGNQLWLNAANCNPRLDGIVPGDLRCAQVNNPNPTWANAQVNNPNPNPAPNTASRILV